jgi:small-conductance mechanosensitive channel
MPAWLKSSQGWIAGGLIALALSAVLGSVLTGGGPQDSTQVAAQDDEHPALVDERPLQTARAIGKLAIGTQELQAAKQASELADNEVDLAFHDALRDASNHPPQTKAANRPLFQRANEAAAQVSNDQNAVDDLKKQLASAKPTRQENLQEEVDVAQAQLELDQDELNDAKEDLVRAGADPGSLIQRQFDQHQAAEHGSGGQTAQNPTSATPAPTQASSLLARFNAWRSFHDTVLQLQSARDGAEQLAGSLSREHDALTKQIESEKKKRTTSSPSAASTAASASPGTQPATNTAKETITSLHVLSGDQKNLSDLDKRIQDIQDLQKTYDGWIALVRLRQRSALHDIIQSLLWILLILLGVFLADRAVDRYVGEMGAETTRLHTLRAVIRFAIQAVGVLLILLVVFGAPSQMPTILGLAGAGLTVALKDFIVAFVGWFVLMGKNGMRVGDWVEINGVAGQVIEINLLRTVLLETGNWTSTGHPTGRRVAFVNSYAIEGHFFNFTTSGQWLWDEIEIMVPPDKDPYPLIDAIQEAVNKETEADARAAEEEWKTVTSRYRVRAVSAAPAVNLRPTASGVELHVRYITRAHDRYAMRARLNQALVQLLRGKAEGKRESMSAAT